MSKLSENLLSIQCNHLSCSTEMIQFYAVINLHCPVECERLPYFDYTYLWKRTMKDNTCFYSDKCHVVIAAIIQRQFAGANVVCLRKTAVNDRLKIKHSECYFIIQEKMILSHYKMSIKRIYLDLSMSAQKYWNRNWNCNVQLCNVFSQCAAWLNWWKKLFSQNNEWIVNIF